MASIIIPKMLSSRGFGLARGFSSTALTSSASLTSTALTSSTTALTSSRTLSSPLTPQTGSRLCFSSSARLRDAEAEAETATGEGSEDAERNQNFDRREWRERKAQLPRLDMRFRNHVTLMGRVVQEPMFEVGGTTFRLVTKSYYRDMEGEVRQSSQYHNVVVPMSNQAMDEYAQSNIHRGDRLYIEGALKYVLEDALDGRTKKAPIILADELITVAQGNF